MLGPELNRLRARLDGLKEGRVLEAGLLSRARALLERDEAPRLDTLLALDRDFDRAGVHTAADARLLRELGKMKGRLPDVTPGLGRRAAQALAELEQAVRRAERQLSASELPPGTVTQLEADFVRLARAVKIATLFEAGAADVPQASSELLPHARALTRPPPQNPKLAVAEFWATRARENVADLLQKRRDLDLAHELLLRASAGAPDRERLRTLRLEVAAARERVRSVPAVRSLHDLVRHVRHVAKKDPGQAYRSLRSLYERAVEAGDAEVAGAAGDASRAMLPPTDQVRGLVERANLRRTLGVKDGEARELSGPERVKTGGRTGLDDRSTDMLAQLAFELDERHLDQLNLASGCARYFDVEDALTEEVVEAELGETRPVQRRVNYPTQIMTYEHTNSLAELPNFVIHSPGNLIHALASNQQLVRAYLEEEPPKKPKRLRQTAVRVYVLDASGSMHGPRASFRDAILIAELNSIRVKARQGAPFDPLYFSFFNDSPTELARVDHGAEAMRQIEKLFRHSPAEGQTDITLALMSAFESIRAAIGKDPYLARATVVLVTDGEDAVDLELVRRTRKPFEGLSISLSFISLGEENPDLRSLVLEQRGQGERAFYSHLSDSEIGVAPTEFDTTFRTLLPPDVVPSPAALEGLLPHLEALEAIASGRPAPERLRSASQFESLFSVPADAPSKRTAAPALLRLVDVLDAVAEAASLAAMDDRAQEAVVLLLHLLGLYGVSVTDYLDALRMRDPKVGQAIERVRLLCRPYT
ncbi:MAG: VWA domain-containing protein [Archangiaceae bacterium]|nr:VWA domain-containing protein [Archangiaceae bacterium]